MKVMIVEDDPVTLSLVHRTLEKTSDMDVGTAKTGEEAWELFREEKHRIVISDWMLPNLSGLELCRKIRSFEKDAYTYVIIMTAKDSRDDVLAAFSSGADDYVSKPFDIQELHARINTGKRIIQLEDDHKALHEVLKNSRNKIRTVFDALPEEILTVDHKMKVESLNKSALNIMEGKFNSKIERRCCSLSEEGGSDFYKIKSQRLAEEGFKHGKTQSLLDEYEKKDGSQVIKERIVLPVKTESGSVRQVVFVSRDITEEHQRNKEVEELNRALKKISSELIKKNTSLGKALDNLERTQAQMLQSEKMASIGQLAAGVAHEINNPTGFVSSNLKTLGDYQADMQSLLAVYEKMKNEFKKIPEKDLPEEARSIISEVDSLEIDIDIEYIKEDVQDLINDCREGTERIKKIVEDLKYFAHPGEEKMKETDINACIESTLNVVHNELKYKAEIIKQFGEVPIVYAHPQQLNQVFMNILVNAAQAIEKSGKIRISTSTVEGKVEIRIADTGCGISKDNLSKVFDPFFTTKDVGSGTGLGMNIAYNIINKHNGTIEVTSEINEGTTFIIQLPY